MVAWRELACRLVAEAGRRRSGGTAVDARLRMVRRRAVALAVDARAVDARHRLWRGDRGYTIGGGNAFPVVDRLATRWCSLASRSSTYWTQPGRRRSSDLAAHCVANL